MTAIINRPVEGARDPLEMSPPRSVLSPAPADEIHETVLQVIWSSGFAFSDEEQKVFQELQDSVRDRIRRSDAERLLKTILDVPDPLVHPLWWAEASDLRLSLNGVLRSRWAAKWKKEGRNQEPSLRSVRWDHLTDNERSELRDMIWQIGMSFPLSLPRGPRRKDRIDQLIRDLVLAYHQLRGDERPDQAFSTSSKSRINQFVDKAFECLRRNRPGAVQFSSSNVYRRVVRLAQETRAEQNKAGEKDPSE